MLKLTHVRRLASVLLLFALGFSIMDTSVSARTRTLARTTKTQTSTVNTTTTNTKTTSTTTVTATTTATSKTTTGTITAHATVDFSLSAPQKNLSGFLHGFYSTSPTDTLLQPLKPTWWRVAADDTMTYSRATRLGAQPIIVVSDAYGYPQDNWQGNGAPWQNNWANWEAKVRQLARQYKNIPVYWDIWNEPDTVSWNTTQFWNGTPAQFYETYRRAYNILRQELGASAMIGGPSYANYDQAAMTAFLTYCNQNNLQVNFLSWHELSEVDASLPSITQHLSTMRSLANSMPNLRMQKILITESVGPKITYSPGDIIGTLYYLELGGADGADKACWYDSKGQNNCYNGSVDGIINPYSSTGPAPRAAWWAYKTYADGIASRVKATTDNANLVVMASKTPGQVLLGYIGTKTTAANVSLNLRNLGFIGQKGGTVTVNVAKVPNAQEATVSNLSPISSSTVPVTNGSATLTISGIKLHEEYVVYLTP